MIDPFLPVAAIVSLIYMFIYFCIKKEININSIIAIWLSVATGVCGVLILVTKVTNIPINIPNQDYYICIAAIVMCTISIQKLIEIIK